MSAHVAAPHAMPGRVLAVMADPLVSLLPVLSAAWEALRPKLVAVWREWWLSLLAGVVGTVVAAGIVFAGFLLDDAGYHFGAMALVFSVMLGAAFSVAWMLSDGES